MTHVYIGKRSVVCLKGPIVVHVHCMIENVFITTADTSGGVHQQHYLTAEFCIKVL